MDFWLTAVGGDARVGARDVGLREGRGALLFAWRGLLDEARRIELFGEALDTRAARLPDWGRFRGSDDQLFIRPSLGDEVRGIAISVGDPHLEAADACCDQIGLVRAVTMVDVCGERLRAYVYTRASGEAIKIFR